MYLGKTSRSVFIIVFLIVTLSVDGQPGKSFRYRFESNTKETTVVAESQSLVIDYSLPELSIDDITIPEGDFYRISIPGHTHSSETGKPELPVFSRLIILPQNSTYKIRISNVNSKTLLPSENDISGKLYPAQESGIKQEENRKPPFAIDKKIYRTKRLLNSDTVIITKLGKIRGKQLANLTISPVRYNPGSNKIEVITSMRIEVLFGGTTGSVAKSLNQESPLFNEVLDKGIINYYPSDLITGFTDRPAEMIILTDTSFRKFIKPLIDWKIQKGYLLDVLYRGEGETGTSYSELKESISKIYNASASQGYPPEFLLIIGDADRIPYYGSGYVTDTYYGEFDGDGDYIPDMFIGRIPASDTLAVMSAVQKIIQYEKFEFADTNRFYSNALAIAGKDATYANYMNGQVRYSVTNYLNSANRINEYHFYYPDGYTKKDSVMKLISKGLSFINYTGHGSADSWLHLDIKGTDVKNFNNTGRYPFVISNACRTAAFNDTASLGSKMMTARLKGAIGFIGCTNDSYWDEDFYWAVGVGIPTDNPKYTGTGLGAYDRLFHTHGELPSDWYINMGQINYAGNLSVSASTSARKKYYWETYTLLGDPSIIPIIGTPQTFAVSIPDTIPNGTTSLSLSPGPFAYVALSHFNTLWAAAYANPSGSVTLNMPGLSNDSCLIVITGQNRKPLIKTIYFSNVTGEYVNMNDPGLDDASGNNNGKADFGETINLNLYISNLGQTDASNLTASISSTSPWIIISKNFTTIGTLAARSQTTLSNVLEFTINKNVPDQGIITIDLLLKDTKTEKRYKIDIRVHSPRLEIVNCIIDDSMEGNNNSMADPGETFNLVFQVRNLGSSSTSGQFMVGTEEPELQIPDQNIKSGVLQFGETTDIPVMVKLADNARFGDFIFVSSLLDCNPFIVSKDFSFRVGRIRESFESASFRVFPWINISSNPWIISHINTVDGILSAHSGQINHNGTSSLMIRVQYPEPDSLRFFYKVSSEPNYDYLALNINDNEVLRKSGELPWTRVSVPVQEGVNKIEWVYRKDNSVSQGADAAWIDLVDFSLSSEVTFIGRDLCVARVVTPVQKDIYGFEPVSVKVLNLGNDTLKGFYLAYAVNEHPPVTQFFDSYLAPYQDSLTVTFERRADLDLNGHYDISVFGYNNNDEYPANDTLKLSLVNTEIEETIHAYPNPFTDLLNIDLNSKSRLMVRINLINTTGKQVVTTNRELIEGENQIVLETGKLSPGVYILSITGGTYSKTTSLVKISQ
jgi:hypothetical protein